MKQTIQESALPSSLQAQIVSIASKQKKVIGSECKLRTGMHLHRRIQAICLLSKIDEEAATETYNIPINWL